MDGSDWLQALYEGLLLYIRLCHTTSQWDSVDKLAINEWQNFTDIRRERALNEMQFRLKGKTTKGLRIKTLKREEYRMNCEGNGCRVRNGREEGERELRIKNKR